MTMFYIRYVDAFITRLLALCLGAIYLLPADRAEYL